MLKLELAFSIKIGGFVGVKNSKKWIKCSGNMDATPAIKGKRKACPYFLYCFGSSAFLLQAPKNSIILALS
ncbi:hypothetical protein Runsl_3460 [Runella slithyformis DSM 19594]|uniref:Uncharacterized protein n=1 Tax=Runella slithyformis (strain ATCC 29530 / DSM 19594 / LMG 11500 / NCIMB 11436 / LSU 4) TaxID=761193 RepID=A0A7U3ZM96_RUNSL|nr:hypothetical protein Runsl_3460 [Runella slithyformis DSM 19594]